MKNVLVLDANQRSALAVTRSLGKQNIPVFTADDTLATLAGSSKFSKQHFIYPAPGLYPEQFIQALSKLVTEFQIDILLPMTELTSMLLLMHKSTFPNVTIPFPDLETVESLSNKCLLMKTANSLGIPVPHTWYAEDRNNLPCELRDLVYPVVLKPGKSWLFHEGQWRRATVRFANNSTEAKNILETDWAFKANAFMLQETISGHGAGVFAIYDNGKPLALFAHRRLREKPPSGGVSVLSESVPVEPELAAHAKALLNKANWHGVAMVEFKVAADGTPYLMEINTRFWGSLQLAVDAGINFPELLYRLACGDQPQPVTHYKTGVKLRWLLGDLDNLYLTLRNRQTPFKTKARSILHFLTPSPLATRYEVNRINDMKPFWHELRQYVRNLTGR